MFKLKQWIRNTHILTHTHTRNGELNTKDGAQKSMSESNDNAPNISTRFNLISNQVKFMHSLRAFNKTDC